MATIGVSVYRQPFEWVQCCVASALQQTRADIEVILRPDGPEALKPQIRAWLRRLAREDNRLRLLEGKTRRGTFGSLRSIFEQANGQYFIQLDADDMLSPQAVELTTGILEANPSLSMVYTHCMEVDDKGQTIGLGSRQKTRYSDISMLAQFITFHLRCINREHYAQTGGYRATLKYTGDYDLSLRLGEKGGVQFLPLPLYYYRVHQHNTSRLRYEETVDEAYDVAWAALHRRGLAGRYHLIRRIDNRISVIHLGKWSRVASSCEDKSIILGSTSQRWL